MEGWEEAKRGNAGGVAFSGGFGAYIGYKVF
jgi:hypothetical protein